MSDKFDVHRFDREIAPGKVFAVDRDLHSLRLICRGDLAQRAFERRRVGFLLTLPLLLAVERRHGFRENPQTRGFDEWSLASRTLGKADIDADASRSRQAGNDLADIAEEAKRLGNVVGRTERQYRNRHGAAD